MSASVVLDNAPAYAGWAAFALFLVLLIWASAVHLRERRVPNKLVAAIAITWAATRVLLVAALVCAPSGADGNAAAAWIAQPVALVATMGIPPFDLTLEGGLMGALVLGGGSLAASVAFEAITRRASMGGGDIKLLAVVGLFLGWERGLWCLFAACLASVAVRTIKRVRAGEMVAASGTFPFAPAILFGVVVASAL